MLFFEYLSQTFLWVFFLYGVLLVLASFASFVFQRIYIWLLPERETWFKEHEIPWIFWVIILTVCFWAVYGLSYFHWLQSDWLLQLTTLMQGRNLALSVLVLCGHLALSASIAYDMQREEQEGSFSLNRWLRWLFIWFSIFSVPSSPLYFFLVIELLKS